MASRTEATRERPKGSAPPAISLSSWIDRHISWFFVLPAVLFLGAVLAFPVIYTGGLSLFRWSGAAATPPAWVGLGNYADVFAGDPGFRNAIWVLKTPNVDHCARLCHASTVVGLAGTFGSGAMTQSIADIAQAKSLFIIGSNTFEQHPLIGRRVMQAKAKGAKIISRRPALHPHGQAGRPVHALLPGTDVAIFNGIMQQIIKNGWENKEFIQKRTKDFDKLKAAVMKPEYSRENVSKISGIPAKDLATAAEWIAKSGATAVLYSMGITQHTTGVDNVKRAVVICSSPNRKRAKPPNSPSRRGMIWSENEDSLSKYFIFGKRRS